MSAYSKNNKILRQVYLRVLTNNIKQYHATWLIKKIIYRILKELSWVILLPIAILMHMIGFRRLLIRVEHIGHLAAEFDTHIKAQRLSLLPKQRKFYFVLAPRKIVSNAHLLTYWAQYFTIISNPMICSFLSILTRRYFVRQDVSHYISQFFGAQEIYKINKLWGHRSPILRLKKEDESWGECVCKQLGIAKNKWFVCLHVREGGFLPHNEVIQSHRNASIENMIPAIKEIVRRGGLVVRMGDPSMTPLPKMLGVIDYAHHPLKSARMDVILCAKARFFLGCTSGLSFLSSIFGVPVALANMIPTHALGVYYHDLCIPKLLFNETGEQLSFREIMSSDIGSFYFSHQYQAAGLSVRENSEEDILALTAEMLDRIEGNFIEKETDKKLQERYLSMIKPWHYSYPVSSKVGLAFLRKYQALF